MALNKATFRAAFPEFTDILIYPDTMLDYWYFIAGLWVGESKWGDYYTHGMSLVLAHFLVLAVSNSTSGGGGNSGLVSNESAGDVSVGYDTSNTVEKDGGNWNLTSYGQQYLRIGRLIGGVAVQI